MGKIYKVAAFDLDGTLMDTSPGIISSVKHTIDLLGLRTLSLSEMQSFIGPPMQDSFERAFGLSREEAWDAAGVFREEYKKEENLLLARPYDGIFEVMKTLKENGVIPVIATYKRCDYALSLLKHFGFHNYTDIIYGSDFEGKLKKKDIILKAITDAGANPDNADGTGFSSVVMVGDSDNDAIGAAQIGADFIGVTYGFGFKCDDDVRRFEHIGIASDTQGIADIILQGI